MAKDPNEIPRGRKFLVALIVITSMVLTTLAFYAWQILVTPNVLVDKKERLVLIPEDADFKYVQNMLYDEDIVQDLVTWSLVAKLMDYDQLIKPGLYELQANMTNVESVRLLRSGAQTPTRITFNNVRTLEELAGKITKGIALDSATLVTKLKAPDMPARFGLEAETFLGMFLPNTYEVYYTLSADDLLERMHREYQAFWNETRRAKAKEQGLSPEEVMTLASIVNAETVMRDEAPVVAGLYLNRLKRGIPLQADPTLIYALGDFSIRRVLNVHKEIDSPYNTYKNAGLPPGPINLPPLYAVEAVLNPAAHNYIYMCAREDFSGYHYFTASLAEHNRNARKYQQALNRMRVYN